MKRRSAFSRRSRRALEVRKGSIAERVLAMAQAAGRPRRAASAAAAGAEPLEVGFALEPEHALLLVGEHVLAEARVEGREPLVDLGQPSLVVRRERRALAYEPPIDDLREPLLLRGEAARLAGLMDGADACEERLVLNDLVAQLRELRRRPGLHLADLRTRHRRRIDPEQPPRAIERGAARLQLCERVLERRRRGRAGDRGDLGALFGDRRLQGGNEVLGPDLVEGRRAAMRSAPGPKNRIVESAGIAGGHAGELDD